MMCGNCEPSPCSTFEYNSLNVKVQFKIVFSITVDRVLRFLVEWECRLVGLTYGSCGHQWHAYTDTVYSAICNR